MAPQLLFDISDIDYGGMAFDADAIEKVNPHRGAMRLIDGIIYSTDDLKYSLAYRDIKDDEFWVPGHIPGRPIFPGVLMVEAGAQLASFICLSKQDIKFMGFAGLEDVKFRGQVVPGDRLYILCELVELRPRRSKSLVQGVVDGRLVFEAKIIGMPL
jgi:3-hydroxyacyl-[acyl-carrier-protein] dehydratase